MFIYHFTTNLLRCSKTRQDKTKQNKYTIISAKEVFPLKKILFTNLFGTLIRPNSSISNKYFYNIDKEFSFICQYKNEFLRKGNYIAIVTEPGGHDKFSTIFNNQLTKLNSYIENNSRSHIVYYLQGNGKIYPEDHIRKENINGKLWYIGNSHFSGIAINKKEKAINDFLKTIQPPYQIYGTGDSAKDIPMLLEVEKAGGKSSIIDTSLYRYSYKETIADKIIEHQLKTEFVFKIHQVYANNRLKRISKDSYSEEEVLLYEKKENRKQNLYQLLYEGKLNLDELTRNYSKHCVCLEYEICNSLCLSKMNKFYENYPFSEEVYKVL